jgi:Contractile injection system tube protein/T4-like virus tail tube protein gp19
MTVPSPFDVDYTHTNFTGFSLSVDLVGGDQSLGANWQILDLGDTTLSASDANAGGYHLSRFQLLHGLQYGNVTLRRPWTPNQSGWIPEWFSLAEQYGGTAVGITINYLDVNGVAQSATYNFRNAYPVTWSQPSFAAFDGQQVLPIVESLTFSHSGYFNTDGLAAGIDTAEAVQPCKLVILPGSSGSNTGIASALASLTTWTLPGAEYGLTEGVTSASSTAAAGMLGPFPSVTFWVPPSTVNVSKSAYWDADASPTASGSGPVTWNGTAPMDISFDFILDGASSDSNIIQSTATQGQNIGEEGPSSTSVMPVAEQLLSLLEVDPASALLGFGSAPLVVLIWGEFVSPVSYMVNLNMNFTRFNASGTPIRAEGNISMRQYPVFDVLQNPTSGGELPRQSAVLYDGDTLAHVAYRSYRSPARWRDLAQANGIDDPMRMQPGTTMLVPASAELPPRGESGVAKQGKPGTAAKLRKPLSAGGGSTT